MNGNRGRMKRLYVRCNGGHYFLAGAGCPLDGWAIEGVSRVAAHFTFLQQAGGEVTIESLAREAHASEELRKRLLLIEFGDEEAVFEALVPEAYLYRGQQRLVGDLPLELL